MTQGAPNPTKRSDKFVGPLNKGVALDADSFFVPPGALTASENALLHSKGLMPFPAGSWWELGDGPDAEATDRVRFRHALGRSPVRQWLQTGAGRWIFAEGLAVRWESGDDVFVSESLVLGDPEIAGSSFVDAQTTEVTLDSAVSGMAVGDWLRWSGDGRWYARRIVSVESSTVIRIDRTDPLEGDSESAPPLGPCAVLAGFGTQGSPTKVYGDTLYVASGRADIGLLRGDALGGAISEVNPDQDPTIDSIRNVLAFNDRVWIGNFREDNTPNEQTADMQSEPTRIRWTTKTDLTEFPIAQWLDIRTEGIDEIRGMLALGDLMIVWGANLRAALGRLSSIQGQPVTFRKFDLPQCGPSGPHAWAYGKNGLFAANRTGLYFFGPDGRVEQFAPAFLERELETEIRDATAEGSLTSLFYHEELDALFLAIGGASTYTSLWSFSFKLGAWTELSGPRARDVIPSGALVLGNPDLDFYGFVGATANTTEDWVTFSPDAYSGPSLALTNETFLWRTGALMLGDPESRETVTELEIYFDREIDVPVAVITLRDPLDPTHTWSWTGAIDGRVLRLNFVWSARATEVEFACSSDLGALFVVSGLRIRGRSHGDSALMSGS